MKAKITLILVAVLGLAFVAVMQRYEFAMLGGHLYKLDHWTGRVVVVHDAAIAGAKQRRSLTPRQYPEPPYPQVRI